MSTDPTAAPQPDRSAELAAWLEYRDLPPDASLADLIEAERGAAKLAARFELLHSQQPTAAPQPATPGEARESAWDRVGIREAVGILRRGGKAPGLATQVAAVLDDFDDLSELAIRLANAVEHVAGLSRPLTAGAPSGTNERAALETLAADARQAGLLPTLAELDAAPAADHGPLSTTPPAGTEGEHG